MLGSCVEALRHLDVSSGICYELSHPMLGALLMTQASSIRHVMLTSCHEFTGSDSAILVSCYTRSKHCAVPVTCGMYVCSCSCSCIMTLTPALTPTLLTLAQSACTALQTLEITSMFGCEQRGVALLEVRQLLSKQGLPTAPAPHAC